MVNTQIIANELNNKLNTIANVLNLGHQFRLMAHIGKTKQGNAIEGILKPVNNDVLGKGAMDTGTVNSQIVYVAEVIVPTAIDNKSVLGVENAITKLVHDYNGYSFVNGSDNIIWELSMGTPKDYAMRGGTGLSMPMAFTVKVSYSDVGLINGIKVWTLDGETIPYTGEGVILDKEGVTLSVVEAKTQQTIPTSQRKQYKFTIPYDKTNVVCRTLQNDILNGDFRKTYQLAYNDGVITYSAQVSLFKTGDIGSQKTGDATMLNVSFVDAGTYVYYDDRGNQIQYQIGLINFPFDDQSENTLYFDSQATQQAYMEGKVFSESTTYRDMTAPNLNTTIMTNVVYNAAQTTTSRLDVSRLAQLNYAVILKTVYPQGSSNPTYSYYYYWVTQCTQGADGILLLDLKLDTIQTYMFDPNLTIPDCLIERAHLNRWITTSNEYVEFDTSYNSKLFGREPITNVSKRLIQYKDFALVPSVDTGLITQQNFDFFNNYLYCWAYVYLDPKIAGEWDGGAYLKKSPCLVEKRYAATGADGYCQMPYIVMCFPIMKGEGYIDIYSEQQLDASNTKRWDFNILKDAFNAGGIGNSTFASYVLNIKFSQEAPFPNFTSFDTYTFGTATGSSLTITDSRASGSDFKQGNYGTFEVVNFGTGQGTVQAVTYVVYRHEMNDLGSSNPRYGPNTIALSWGDFSLEHRFNKNNIINSFRNIKYNPKILLEDYTELKLCQGFSEPFLYDALKLSNGEIIQLYWAESFTPSTNKTYAALYNPNRTYAIYNENTARALVGATLTQDLTFPYSQTQLSQYLAQNKNFAMQSVMQGITPAIGALTGAFSAGGAVNAVGAVAGLGVGTAINAINQSLSIDNMRNAPQSFQNLSGDPILSIVTGAARTRIEIWQATSAELKAADDYMFMNGFSYNQLDSPLDYIHTRKYFNYIKAQLTDIQGVALSNLIRNDIKQRFSNGLRFWDASTFATNGVQYDLENYELWLED